MAASQKDSVELTAACGSTLRISYNTFVPVAQSDLCPIILLHSMVSTKEVWNNVAQTLADKTKRKVYVYDARNHGESAYLDDFNFTRNVEDLFAFMSKFGMEKAVLIGHSMGGQTASRAALLHPEFVEAVISEEMYVKKIPTDFFSVVVQFVEKYIECCEKIPKEVSPADATNKLFDIMTQEEDKNSPIVKETDTLRDANFTLRQKPDGTYDVNFNRDVILRVLKNPDTLADEPEGVYNGPALFIYGSESTFGVGDEKENILKHFPEAHFFEVSDAKHHVHVERAAEFVDKVVEFLTA